MCDVHREAVARLRTQGRTGRAIAQEFAKQVHKMTLHTGLDRRQRPVDAARNV